MSNPTCETCRAFSALTTECRRKSPRAVPLQVNGQLQVRGVYPGTPREGWCAEHIPQAPVQVEFRESAKPGDVVGTSRVTVAPVSA